LHPSNHSTEAARLTEIIHIFDLSGPIRWDEPQVGMPGSKPQQAFLTVQFGY
jgi:hypothetical protein